MEPTNALNVPQPPTGAGPASGAHHSLVTAAGEQCPTCGSPVAPDQRYCLNCGQRCGEPRLPFMDAVTFMDAMKRPAAAPPAPPKPRRRGLSPNTALITGVGTLLLAMGVGVLIGRSGDSAPAPQQTAPIVIEKGGTEAGAAATSATAGKGGGSKGGKKTAKKAAKRAASGAGAEEVLKPAGDVKLPPATVKPGGECPPGSAGCDHGEFTGNFFGE